MGEMPPERRGAREREKSEGRRNVKKGALGRGKGKGGKREKVEMRRNKNGNKMLDFVVLLSQENAFDFLRN